MPSRFSAKSLAAVLPVPALALFALLAGAGCSTDSGMSGEDMMPPNPDGPIGPTPTCTDRAELANFNIDVPSVTLSGKITVAGKTPASMNGSVTLVRSDTGDSVYLGRTGDATYAPKGVV